MNQKQEVTKYLHLIMKIGTGVLVSILSGFAIGLLADRYFGLNGLGILVGVLLGVVLGFYWIYQEVMGIEINEECNEEDSK